MEYEASGLVESAVSHCDWKAGGCLECRLGSLCSAVEGDRWDGKELETRLSPLDSEIWEKRRTDLAYSHSYQSFLFTVKKQVYSNVVLSSYMGQNSSGTLVEESHRKSVDSEQSTANVSGLIRLTEDALEKAWAPYSISEKLTDNAPVSEEPAQVHCQQQALCSRKQES